MMLHTRAQGFSLFELLTVITLVCLLVLAAVPAFTDLIDRIRIKQQTHTLYSRLQLARQLALSSGSDVRVRFQQHQGRWCLGFFDEIHGACDCTQADSCRVSEREYRYTIDNHDAALYRTRFAGGGVLGFSASRGIASDSDGFHNGSVWLRSPRNKTFAVVVSRLGRLRLCEAGVGNCPPAPGA
ncbi:MAG: GspH/FimT family pseudopilin [Gammaproteobacteria bacterium]|nr:GspH/FimT family pseudopilin [Gammaproteobacteria bacterium]